MATRTAFQKLLYLPCKFTTCELLTEMYICYMSETKKLVGVRLSEKTYTDISRVSEENGRSIQAMINDCIEIAWPHFRASEELRKRFLNRSLRRATPTNLEVEEPKVPTMRPYPKESASAVANAARRALRALHKTVLPVNGAGVVLHAA